MKATALKLYSVPLISFTLLACGGGSSDAPAPKPPPVPKTNVQPVANAGENQTAAEQTPISLNGSGTDSDGSIASFLWVQTSGPQVDLQNADKANASFMAPDISQDSTLTFNLTVTDDKGATHQDSVDILIKHQPLALALDAGANQQVNEGDQVQLVGSAINADSTVNQYQWAQTAGTTVQLNNANTANASFTAPQLAANESLTFSLTVTDIDGVSHQDSLEIYIVNQVNSAAAAAHFTYESVTLDCLQSFPQLTNNAQIQWTQTGGPQVNLSAPGHCKTQFHSQGEPGTYRFSLRVTDNTVSQNATLDITTSRYTGLNQSALSNPFVVDTEYSELDALELSGKLYAFSADENYQYLVVDDKLKVVQSQGNQITEVGHVILAPHNDDIYRARRLLVNGQFAYLGYKEGIDIFDLSNPSTPTKVGTYDLARMQEVSDITIPSNLISTILALRLVNNMLYVDWAQEGADDGDNQGAGYGYQVLDLSNPSQPEFIGAIITSEFSQPSQHLFNSRGKHYFWDQCALVAGTPESVSDWQRLTCNELLLNTDVNLDVFTYRARAPEYADGIQVTPFDILDTSKAGEDRVAPKVSQAAGIANVLHYHNSDDLVSRTQAQLQILDTQNPLQPFTRALYQADGLADGMTTKNDKLYFSLDGLKSIKLDPLKNQTPLPFALTTEATYQTVFSYQQNSIEEAECRVTSGQCTVSLDKIARTLTLNWTLGNMAGDHELMVLAGNSNYLLAAKDKVRVIAN